MNAHEKKIVNMTAQEIAVKATEMIRQRIEEKLPGEAQYFSPWDINDIVSGTLNEFVPKQTMGKLGLMAHFSVTGAASYKAVGETGTFHIQLRKSHPCFCELLKRDALRDSWGLFIIKRKYVQCRGTRVLAFDKVLCGLNDDKKLSLVDLANRLAGWIVYRQKSHWEAARTLLRYHEELGSEKVKELSNALKALSHVPSDSFYGLDWSNPDVLMSVGGLMPRTQAILRAAAAGKHVVPGGVKNADILPLLSPAATEASSEEVEPGATKQLNVTVFCSAVYNSSIRVPADMTIDEGIAYAKEHLKEVPLGTLEYIMDSDELDEENCDFEEDA